MILEEDLVDAVFVERLNRFAVSARIDGRMEPCHLPNPGRLEELLRPDLPLILRPAGAKVDRARKTDYNVLGVLRDGHLATIDSRIPNILVREALEAGRLKGFRGYSRIVPEPTYLNSRLDFLLPGDPAVLIEVKSCTLVREGTALFPDAPTRRGERHLRDLLRARGDGFQTAVIFVIQHPGARRLCPNRETDPGFSLALAEAVEGGVQALSYTVRLKGKDLRLHRQVPVLTV